MRRLALEVVAGPDEHLRLRVETSPISIGRAPDNELPLSDRAVSRHHCRLVPADDCFLLRDAGSRNGTFVNGVRIFEVALERGSHLQIGHTRIRFDFLEEGNAHPSSDASAFGELVGGSDAMRRTFELLRSIARTGLTCLLLGETGTGKELAARAVHDNSGHAEGPFVVLDCAGISPNLIEDKLFGHARGAFTGAVADARGAFEEASGGTIFLDEIGELPLPLQPKLLRVLERREVTRLGSHRNVPVDVRVIAATHRDLQAMVAKGDFRKDLYYRLSEATVVLPPLRDRPDDVVQLARHMLELDWGQPAILDPKAVALLEQHSWPGNVRELRNVLRRVRAMSPAGIIEAALVASVIERPPTQAQFEPEEPATSVSLAGTGLPMAQARDEHRKEYLKRLLEQHGDDHVAIASQMGVHIKYARRLMRRYGLIP